MPADLRACSTACCANRCVGWALRCLRTYDKYAYAGSSRSALASIRSRRLPYTLSIVMSPESVGNRRRLFASPRYPPRLRHLEDRSSSSSSLSSTGAFTSALLATRVLGTTSTRARNASTNR